jgi:hypothetical protein
MSNAMSFMNSYVNNIQQLINFVEELRVQNAMMSGDNTLVNRYFEEPGSRTDIVASDVNAAYTALQQVIFAYDSGNPTQKSLLFKMLP